MMYTVSVVTSRFIIAIAENGRKYKRYTRNTRDITVGDVLTRTELDLL